MYAVFKSWFRSPSATRNSLSRLSTTQKASYAKKSQAAVGLHLHYALRASRSWLITLLRTPNSPPYAMDRTSCLTFEPAPHEQIGTSDPRAYQICRMSQRFLQCFYASIQFSVRQMNLTKPQPILQLQKKWNQWLSWRKINICQKKEKKTSGCVLTRSQVAIYSKSLIWILVISYK